MQTIAYLLVDNILTSSGNLFAMLRELNRIQLRNALEVVTTSSSVLSD